VTLRAGFFAALAAIGDSAGWNGTARRCPAFIPPLGCEPRLVTRRAAAPLRGQVSREFEPGQSGPEFRVVSLATRRVRRIAIPQLSRVLADVNGVDWTP
jgi:hypothetical protein